MGKLIADRDMKLGIYVHLLLSLLMLHSPAFPIPLRRESRVTGYGLAGNRLSYTYWLANAFVFFVRDNLVNTPKMCTSTSHLLACSQNHTVTNAKLRELSRQVHDN